MSVRTLARSQRVWVHLERLGVWGTLDRVVVGGSGFLVAIAVARTGGPQALGMFALLQSATLLLAGLLKAAFADPIVIEAHGEERLDGLAVARPLALAHLGLGAVGAIAWALIGGRVDGLPAPAGGELLVALLLPFASFTELARSFRLARLDERGLFTGDLCVAIARLGVVGIGLHRPGLMVGLTALAAGGVASLTTVAHDLVRPGGFRELPRLWRLGRWLVGESALYSVTTYGIWAFVVPRAGTAVAGQLRAAQQLFVPVQTVVVGLNTVLLARFARAHGRPRNLSVEALQVGLTAAWGVLLVSVGPAVTTVLFGSLFRLSRWNLTIFTAALMAGVLFDVSALRLRAARVVRPLITARIATSVVALGGAALAGSSFTGVAASMLASQLTGIYMLHRLRPDAGPLTG
jgi:O-antigen/teichoic acid export membrane protein